MFFIIFAVITIGLVIWGIMSYWRHAFEEPISLILSLAFVGIAVDEQNRIAWEIKEGNKMPLVDFNITEAQAFEICKKYNVLSPAYEDFNRLGCWFCHKQNNKALSKVIEMYPDIYSKIEELDKDSHIKFKQKFSAKEIKRKLKNGDK